MQNWSQWSESMTSIIRKPLQEEEHFHQSGSLPLEGEDSVDLWTRTHGLKVDALLCCWAAFTCCFQIKCPFNCLQLFPVSLCSDGRTGGLRLTRCLLWRCRVPAPPAPRPDWSWRRARDSHPGWGWWSDRSLSEFPEENQKWENEAGLQPKRAHPAEDRRSISTHHDHPAVWSDDGHRTWASIGQRNSSRTHHHLTASRKLKNLYSSVSSEFRAKCRIQSPLDCRYQQRKSLRKNWAQVTEAPPMFRPQDFWLVEKTTCCTDSASKNKNLHSCFSVAENKLHPLLPNWNQKHNFYWSWLNWVSVMLLFTVFLWFAFQQNKLLCSWFKYEFNYGM